MTTASINLEIIEKLAVFYRRNGYVRRRTLRSVGSDGKVRSRCADELRLTAQSLAELREIRRLLQGAGFRPGSAFAKKRQLRIPVYGRRAVERFLEMIGQ